MKFSMTGQEKGDRMGRFDCTCAIFLSPLSCEFEFHSWRGVLDAKLCDKVLSVACLATGRGFLRYFEIFHRYN